jgi:hypothetical protein
MAGIGGDQERFVKPGASVPADGSGPSSAAILVPPTEASPGDGEWGVRSVAAGFAVDLDASALVDVMSRALLAHHRKSIASGQRPDGGGAQKPLGRQALADPDRESPHRGYNTGLLADDLRRTAITSNGASASCRILPPTARNAYVAKEAARGVVLLTGAGAAGEAAVDAARAAVAVLVTGRTLDSNPAGVTAKDTDT